MNSDYFQDFKDYTSKNTNLVMVMIIFSIGIINLFYGEKMQLSNGFGADGVIYGNWARDFFGTVFKPGDYQIFKRIFPSAFVHFSLCILRIPLSDINIIKGFEIYNFVLLLITVYTLGLITDYLNFSNKGKWLAFTGFFLNFIYLKHMLYIPVISDVSAFTFGTLLLYFYLKKNRIALLIVMIIGTFSWPIFIFGAMILLLFPTEDIIPAKTPNHYNIIFSILIVAGAFGYIYYRHFIQGIIRSNIGHNPINESVIALSIGFCLTYLFFGLKNILDSGSLYQIGSWIKRDNMKYILIGLFLGFLFTCIVIVTLAASTKIPGGVGRLWTKLYVFFDHLLIAPVARPFYPVVPHISCFGPLIILTIFLWKQIARTIHQYGNGLTLFMTAHFILTTMPSSRQLLNFFPFFVIFTVKAFEEFRFKASYYWFIAIISLLYSKVWLRINVTDTESSLLNPLGNKYIMNYFLYNNDFAYIAHTFIVIITIIVFYFVFSNKIFSED
ncbi:MAG: hypothetical protein HQK91_06910 [Nitrospirae bacterium]|nr:hypothetical protein [Nitrospirota bacterium]